MLKYLLTLAPVLFLMSCASLTEDECRADNWESIGFIDGTNGRLQSFISQHGEACSDFGITPNTTEWLKGRLEGLKTYCTPQSVYEVGRRGREMNPVCSADQTSELKLANFYGLRFYEIDTEIDQLESELDDILNILATDFNGDLTPEQIQLRSFYLSEIRSLEREIRDLGWELRKYDELP